MSLLGHQASSSLVSEALVFSIGWGVPPVALIVHTFVAPFWSPIKATRWLSGDQTWLAAPACSKKVSWTGSPPATGILKMFVSSEFGPRANAIRRPPGEKLGV